MNICIYFWRRKQIHCLKLSEHKSSSDDKNAILHEYLTGNLSPEALPLIGKGELLIKLWLSCPVLYIFILSHPIVTSLN